MIMHTLHCSCCSYEHPVGLHLQTTTDTTASHPITGAGSLSFFCASKCPPVPLSSLSFGPLSTEHFKGPNMLCLRPFCPLPLLQPQNIGFNPAQANLATCSLTFMTFFVLLQNITSIMTSHKCAMFTNRHQFLCFWSQSGLSNMK